MTAAELQAIGQTLSWHVGQTFTPQHQETFAQAAEIIELIAWAEENKVDVQRGNYFWWSRSLEDGHAGEKTLVGLLRRAREAAR